ncbi:hypothetical protein POM88_045168 [Heracleum sosnowskyi]|uniref:Protein FAR1-RELATED SEQUENCE n=1 Tax=Heracleum sosnowskyi TaxID=360622 RepID=A0AAD8M5U5_9APIA|nr:hypothetical protein POM88_045168 [Heracleum sosnowskyi]
MKHTIADVFDKEKTHHEKTSFKGRCCIVYGWSSLKHFVWGENLDASEFEACWKYVLEAYDLTDNHWFVEMYECRHLWIPAYFRDDPLLGILHTTSWSESANSFLAITISLVIL